MKRGILLLLVFFVLAFIFIFTITLSFSNIKNLLEEEKQNTCGDGSKYGVCSENKPYFCKNGTLIERPSLCKCPKNMNLKNGECTSKYEEGQKTITFDYFLRGNESSIDFSVYKGVSDYVSNISRDITYYGNEKTSRRDFKLKAINISLQKSYIYPLIAKIENLAPNNEKEQVRIAVSLVQNLPYKASNKTIEFSVFNREVNYTRYPYEVLYKKEGICGERANLLALLLGELGYGTAILHYPSYDHEAVGIRCPKKQAIGGTEYCLIETTDPTIISSSNIPFQGIGKLERSPMVYQIFSGKSLPKNMYEYKDANSFDKIQNSIQKTGTLNRFQKDKREELRKKYGLTF